MDKKFDDFMSVNSYGLYRKERQYVISLYNIFDQVTAKEKGSVLYKENEDIAKVILACIYPEVVHEQGMENARYILSDRQFNVREVIHEAVFMRDFYWKEMKKTNGVESGICGMNPGEFSFNSKLMEFCMRKDKYRRKLYKGAMTFMDLKNVQNIDRAKCMMDAKTDIAVIFTDNECMCLQNKVVFLECTYRTSELRNNNEYSRFSIQNDVQEFVCGKDNKERILTNYIGSGVHMVEFMDSQDVNIDIKNIDGKEEDNDSYIKLKISKSYLLKTGRN